MDFRAGWPCSAGRCHPVTILYDHSRYALSLAACSNQRTATVPAHLVTAIQRCGLLRVRVAAMISKRPAPAGRNCDSGMERIGRNARSVW